MNRYANFGSYCTFNWANDTYRVIGGLPDPQSLTGEDLLHLITINTHNDSIYIFSENTELLVDCAFNGDRDTYNSEKTKMDQTTWFSSLMAAANQYLTPTRILTEATDDEVDHFLTMWSDRGWCEPPTDVFRAKRVVVTLAEDGSVKHVTADHPIEFYIFNPHSNRDQLYLMAGNCVDHDELARIFASFTVADKDTDLGERIDVNIISMSNPG